jgi:acetyl-CoA carboxylase biotin carboxylase subunit
MFKKILIANRGEIAVRIIRACQELNIRAVAIYSEADAGSMHVRLADEAIPIGLSAPKDSYLRGDKIIQAAKSVGAEAIHPGFGFLSENADFADAVRSAGLIFIGPLGYSMRLMGNKIGARVLMQQAGVPIVPGYEGSVDAEFAEAAGTIGYPVLVKAAAGGGGKGMRVVHHADELQAAIESAQREAHHAFGDATIFLEKYIDGSRHIEFQVFGDAHGHVVHLFERECSVQRRHQKIIEETPSPLLDDVLRDRIGAAAVAAAKAVNYENAGTIEFIVDPQTREYYFLEMNTRLQVEHPITEMITGLDLVKLQIDVALGKELPFTQTDISRRGHAIECRVYAEDPSNDFLPAIGKVLKAKFPSGSNVRVDTGIESGDEVSIHYDPMIAKVVVLGQDRSDAIRKMDWALSNTTILGVTTNTRFLRDVLAHSIFSRGAETTDFVQQEFSNWQMPVDEKSDLAMIAVGLQGMKDEGGGKKQAGNGKMQDASFDPWNVNDGFRVGG